MKRSVTHNHRRSGFTLMEVLLVLVILVVLAGVVAVPLSNTQDRANSQAAKLYVESLEASVKSFKIATNKWPGDLQSLIQPPSGMSPARWGGPHTEEIAIPADPWGNPYQYNPQGQRNNGIKPDIWSLGPDGVENTGDEVGNWPQPQ